MHTSHVCAYQHIYFLAYLYPTTFAVQCFPHNEKSEVQASFGSCLGQLLSKIFDFFCVPLTLLVWLLTRSGCDLDFVVRILWNACKTGPQASSHPIFRCHPCPALAKCGTIKIYSRFRMMVCCLKLPYQGLLCKCHICFADDLKPPTSHHIFTRSESCFRTSTSRSFISFGDFDSAIRKLGKNLGSETSKSKSHKWSGSCFSPNPQIFEQSDKHTDQLCEGLLVLLRIFIPGNSRIERNLVGPAARQINSWLTVLTAQVTVLSLKAGEGNRAAWCGQGFMQ